MADVNRHKEIFTITDETRDYHGGLVKQGDTWISRATFMGREIVTDYTMEEIPPPARLVCGQQSSASDGKSIFEFKSVDGGTEITNIGEGTHKGFFAMVAGPLLRRNVSKQMRKNLERIKGMLES